MESTENSTTKMVKLSKPSSRMVLPMDEGATKHRKGDLDSKIAEDLKKDAKSS